MKHYAIQITSKALADMEGIYNYIAEQLLVPESALEQYNRIADAIENLYIFPERVKIMESEPEHSMEIRRMSVDNYSAFFVIKDECVIITRVLYGASDISKRLLEY
jgi:toxin ParE1/3/4